MNLTVQRSPSTLRTGLRFAKWPWNCRTFADVTSNTDLSSRSEIFGDGSTSITAGLSDWQPSTAPASETPNCWQTINSSHKLNRSRQLNSLERQWRYFIVDKNLA